MSQKLVFTTKGCNVDNPFLFVVSVVSAAAATCLLVAFALTIFVTLKKRSGGPERFNH